MSLKLRRREAAEEEFQMAPMIDMVFLLLVFFMCVSTLAQAQKQVELELPESHESKVPEELANRGILAIDADGQVYIGAEPADLETIQRHVREAVREDPAFRVQVRADQKTPFRDIRELLKTCAEAGAYEVIYATYQAP